MAPTFLRMVSFNPEPSRQKALEIIRKYYDPKSKAYQILIAHSSCVAELADRVVVNHPELGADRSLVYEGALLHDIGIFRCDAKGIGCYGEEPYIRHGIIGSELLSAEGLPQHALICERHTGVGITLAAIIARGLPLPHREMVPVSIEEQIVCFADCFFSKSGNPREQKSVERVEKGLSKFGADQVEIFRKWCHAFL